MKLSRFQHRQAIAKPAARIRQPATTVQRPPMRGISTAGSSDEAQHASPSARKLPPAAASLQPNSAAIANTTTPSDWKVAAEAKK